MAAAGRDALTAEGLSPAASTWLLLLGRALYAAGKALQAVAAGAAPTSGNSSACLVGLLPVPTSAGLLLSSMSNSMQDCTWLLCFYMSSGTAATAAGRSGVQVTLHVPAVNTQFGQAFADVAVMLVAAALHASLAAAARAGIRHRHLVWQVSNYRKAKGKHCRYLAAGPWQ